jgi:hypothetical protein
MALDTKLVGTTSGTGVEVAGTNQLKVIPEVDTITNPANVGAVKAFQENDGGYITGTYAVASGEVDIDYRQRVALDLLLDDEVFNYTTQNFGKHATLLTTMTSAFSAGQWTTNAGNITTTTTAAALKTYATFPNNGTQTLSYDAEVAFSAQPTANTFVEFGLVGPASVQGAAPTDGVFFRLNSAGLQGIATNAGTETSTGVFPLSGGTGTWAYTNDRKYQFIVYVGAVYAAFWVNDGTGAVLLGSIQKPAAQNRICMSQGLAAWFNHRITGGAAGSVFQAKLGAYSVRLGGSNIMTSLSTQGNRIYGSYQGAAGGTMGSLAKYGTITTGNEANPTAAVPTTTTAALGSGLGGSFWETVTLAVNTDGIIMSYQVPAGTVNLAGRRLVLRGLYLSSYVQTVLVGGPYTVEWFLAYGHTSVSLATADGAATKAPRRIPLPFIQQVTAAQAVNTTLAQVTTFCDFGDAPVFVNPGEFVQVCARHLGTVGTSGTVVNKITPIYGWE